MTRWFFHPRSWLEIKSVEKKNEDLREDTGKVKKKKNRKDGGQIESEGMRRRKLKAEYVSPSSSSDTDL